jgi:nicotinamide-nucleotide amidase
MPTEAADALHKILTEGKLTVASAESLTVGGVATHLGECSGSSAYFLGGVIAYNLRQKVRLLHVDRANAAACDCVSRQTACEMVEGVMKLFDADIGIATTGYAEPDPDNGIDKPFAWIAVGLRDPDDRDKASIHHTRVTVDSMGSSKEDRRIDVQENIAYAAIEFCVNVLAPGTLEEE